MDERIKKVFEQMKAKHDDALLLINMGDFYEAYGDDAAIVADVLGITLTDRDGDKVAAFPRSALDKYLPKIVRAGKRVAMCDLPAPETEKTDETGVRAINIDDIYPSPMNPRKTFDEAAINELAQSIKKHGLLQPITVRPHKFNRGGYGYEIVMGERRYRAWRLNVSKYEHFSKEIPCIVREMSDEIALDAMITENLQRKDVDPIEEAFAFGQLLKTGKTIEQIADRFGKSKRFVQERIKLDNLLPELKNWVTKEWMTIGAAMHISKLTEEEQQKFFDEYSEDADEAASDPITKSDVVNFTDDLFMTIERADWHKDFEGSCGTTCNKCPFNNANVGCLFYEMKPHDATCTNRARWDAKRFSWLLQQVTDNADKLVKEGDELETGKTVVVSDAGSEYYLNRSPEYEPLLQRIREMGYKVVNIDDYFERYSSYREGDERLEEKLANNEVYRALVVGTSWKGTDVSIRYLSFKRTSEDTGEEVQAMNLVNQYRENERKNTSNTANKLRDILRDMEPTELSKEPLTQTESLVLMTLILRNCSYKLRSAIKIIANYGHEPEALNYARKHMADVNQICRDYLREQLSSSGVEYNNDLQECQRMLLDEWAKDAADEVVNEMALKLAKKQSKIEESLTALGYNTDGTKMAF